MNDSKDVSQELHDEIPELTIFDFDDNILPIEYESFLVSLVSMEVLIMVFMLIMSHFLLIPSRLTSFLNLASLNLLSLR